VMYFTEKKKQIIKKLKEYGFLLDRNNGDHEIWQHPMLKKPTPVPKHNKISRKVWESIMDDIRAAIAATANAI
jgi:predicted RNA binding protein YcfA (HicA-like mRNA interferase family)